MDERRLGAKAVVFGTEVDGTSSSLKYLDQSACQAPSPMRGPRLPWPSSAK